MDPINSLPPNEQELLHRYHAQAAQATLIDPVLYAMPSQGTSDSDEHDTHLSPTPTPSLSYRGTRADHSGHCLGTEDPSSSTMIQTPTQALPFGTPLALPRPVRRGPSMPLLAPESMGTESSSTVIQTPTHALPFCAPLALPHPVRRGPSMPSLAPESIPAERPTQCHAIKWHHQALESGTKDNSAENLRDHAAPEAPVDTLGSHLDTLKVLHGCIVMPQPSFIVSEASGGGRVEDFTHLFAGYNTFVSHLLIVVDEMASRINKPEERAGEGAGRGDVQNASRVQRRKKLKVEQTTSEQRLVDLVKVCTINCVDSSYLM
jgi:hypothetical protein